MLGLITAIGFNDLYLYLSFNFLLTLEITTLSEFGLIGFLSEDSYMKVEYITNKD